MVDVLTKRIFAENLLNSKSAEDLIKCLSKLLRRYRVEMGRNPDSISMDLERSLISQRFIRYIYKRNKIETTYFENSRRKCFAAEGAILRLRKLYFQNKMWATERNKTYKPMWRELKNLADTLNDRKISIGGRLTRFKPRGINDRNVKKYLKIVKTYDKAFEFSNYVLDSRGYDFGKLAVGNFVYVKLSDISVDVVGRTKKSEKSISSRIFKIEKLFLYVSKDLYVNPGAIVSQAYPKRKKNRRDSSSNSFFFRTKNLIRVPDKVIKKLSL